MSEEQTPCEIRVPARRIALLGLFLMCASVLCPLWVQAQGEAAWEQTLGPAGGKVNVLLVGGAEPSAIYAGVDGGVYVSRDSGATWQCSSDGLPSGQEVRALAMDPADPHILYAGTYSGVYRSTDGGESWSEASRGLTRDLVFSLAVDSADTSVIYAGTDTQVFKSIDGGDQWAASSDGLPEQTVWALQVDRATPGVVYAGTDSGVFQSVDGGQQWRRTGRGIPEGVRVQSLIIDCDTPGLLYAATGVGVYRSMDAAVTWQAATEGIGEEAVHSLAVDPSDPDVLYAAVGTRGVWRSTDGGDTWEPKGGSIKERVLALAVHPTQPQLVYAGTGRGVFRSSRAVPYWEPSNHGLINTTVQQLVAVPGHAGHLYAVTGSDVYSTVDGGQTWSPVNEELARPNVLVLVVDALFPNVLYAGTSYGGIWRSGDGGHTWRTVSTGLAGDVRIGTLIIHRPAEPQGDWHSGVLYAGTNGAGVFQSTDGGLHWLEVNSGLGDLRVQVLVLDSSGTGALYAGTGGGIYRLNLGAGTEPSDLLWQAAQAGLPRDEIRHMVVDARSPDTLYASAATSVGEIYRSIDGGSNWSVVGRGFLPADCKVQALAIDSSSGQSSTLYAATDHGVFCSKDAGSTWHIIDKGLPLRADVLTLLVGAEEPRVYASVSGTGVYRSIYAGAGPLSWQQVVGLVVGLGAAAVVLVLHGRQWVRDSSRYVQDRIFERGWPAWREEIGRTLQNENVVRADTLTDVPAAFRTRTLQQYVQEHGDDDLVLRLNPAVLEPLNSLRVWGFVGNWRAVPTEPFESVVSRIVDQLCHLLGFTLADHRSYKNLHGYVIRAPALRLRMPSTFPTVFSRKRDLGEEDINDLRGLLGILNLSSYLALLVLPDARDPAEEADGLKAYLKKLIRTADGDWVVLDFDDLYRIFLAKDPQRRFVRMLLDQMDLTVVSPYVTAGPVPVHMFFGRDHELETIERAIGEKSFAIVGGGRIGKTSVLAELHRRFTDAEDYHSLYLDCQPVRNYQDLCDIVEIVWGVAVSGCSPEDIMQSVVRMSREQGEQQPVILLDEVDALLEYDAAHEERLSKAMRTLSQQNDCRFVLCGAKVLSSRLHDSDSALFDLCNVVRLGHLNPRETGRIVLEPMREMGIAFEDAGKVVQGVVGLSACHPNIVQYICRELIALVNVRGDRLITLCDVNTVGESRRFGEYLMEVMWGSATPLERLIALLLLNRPGATRAQVEALLDKRGVAVSTAAIEQALDALELYSVLYPKDQEYYLSAPMFSALVTATQDLRSLVDEMTHHSCTPESSDRG